MPMPRGLKKEEVVKEDRAIARAKMENMCKKGEHRVPYQSVQYKRKMLDAKRAEHNIQAHMVAIEALQREQANAVQALQKQQALDFEAAQLGLEEAMIAFEEAKWFTQSELLAISDCKLTAEQAYVDLKQADLGMMEIHAAEKEVLHLIDPHHHKHHEDLSGVNPYKREEKEEESED